MFEQANFADETGQANGLTFTTASGRLYIPLSGIYTSIMVFPLTLLLVFCFSRGAGREVPF